MNFIIGNRIIIILLLILLLVMELFNVNIIIALHTYLCQ